MVVLNIFLSIIIGVSIAFFINLAFSRKLQKKEYKKVGQIVTYFFCVTLTLLFVFFIYIDNFINKFASKQITKIEQEITNIYPELHNKKIDTIQLKKIIGEINKKSIENIGDLKKTEIFFIKILINSISGYVEKSDRYIKEISDSDNKITVNSIFQFAKNKIDWYARILSKIGQILSVILFIIYIAIYFAFIIYLNKNRSYSKKGIVFGEDVENIEAGMR